MIVPTAFTADRSMSASKSNSSVPQEASTDDLHSVASTMEMSKLTKHNEDRSKARSTMPNSTHLEATSAATLLAMDDSSHRSVTPTPVHVNAGDLGSIPESQHEEKAEKAAVAASDEALYLASSHADAAKVEAEEAGFVYVEEEDEQRVNPLFASFNGSEAARRGSAGTDRDVDSDDEGSHRAAPLTPTRQFSNPESQPPKPTEPVKRPFLGMLRFRKPKLSNVSEN